MILRKNTAMSAKNMKEAQRCDEPFFYGSFIAALCMVVNDGN